LPDPKIDGMGEGHELGRRGEAFAADMLRRRGWRILSRNYRLGHKEIDLVVRKGGVVAFVEVKTRAGYGFGDPLEAITRAKRSEIEKVARAWISSHGRPGDRYRFDAVAVIWAPGGRPEVRHVEDAWRL